MFCPKCGAKCMSDDTFCSKCGHKFNEAHINKDSKVVSKGASNTRKLVLILAPILVLLVTVLIITLGNAQKGLSLLAQPTMAATATAAPTQEPAATATPTPTSTPSPTPTPVPYTDEEKVAAKSVLAIRKVLKNPESLQVHNISFYCEKDWFDGFIDMSAQNGFGGMDRKTYSIQKALKQQIDEATWLDTEFGLIVLDMNYYGMQHDFQKKDDYHKKIDIERVMALVESGDVN